MPDHTISENLQRLVTAKSAISNAITAKGGTVGAGDGLEDFATDIGTIHTPVLIEKSITANGEYSASDDSADGYSAVSVSVPNSYSAGDEGKVVQSGALVSQTATSTTTNGTIDTTTNNEVVVAVPNTYAAGDEGKVVSNGALVAQTSDTTTQNGTVDTTLINFLTVNVPSSGGGTSRKDVNFIDYDGTIVHSYTAAEFAELTEFPSNPEHEGLTAQGWMWSTFAKAKAYVAKYGKLDIGQKYRVTDGKTRIYITLDEYRREPVLGLGVNGSVDIDWGDGSAHTTLTGTDVNTYVSTQPHTYPSGGDYMITLTITGTTNFLAKNDVCGLLMKDGFNANESKVYANAIKKLFIGDSVTTIAQSAFLNCYSLGSVAIPDSVTTIGQSAFNGCSSLGRVVIPDSVTTIAQSAFQNCSSLGSIVIPDSVTTIAQSAFLNCYSLGSVVIPDSVTTIAQSAFSGCYPLGSVKFEKATPPTVQNANVFSGISTDCAILVKSIAYLSGSDYPSPNTYTYAYYDTFDNGVSLPAITLDESASLIWYATIADLRAETNPITVGNGKEVYAKMTARTRINNFTSSVNEVSSGTTLITSISCSIGNTIVATFENLGGEYTLPSGWTLLGESGIVSSAGFSQRTGMAYKIAESTTEIFVLAQASSGRMVTNLVNIKDGSIGLFSGFTKNEANNTIIANKPNGLVIWAISTLWWGGTWSALPSNNKEKISGSRCENFLDQSDDTTVSFITNATQESGGLAYASLVITGITDFWHYVD